MAYTLMNGLRRLGLQSTVLATAQVGTIRLRLLKIGALVRVTVRKGVGADGQQLSLPGTVLNRSEATPYLTATASLGHRSLTTHLVAFPPHRIGASARVEFPSIPLVHRPRRQPTRLASR